MIAIQIIERESERTDSHSQGYIAAENLRTLLERDTQSSDQGRILLIPDVLSYGQPARTIDLVVLGEFTRLTRKVRCQAQTESGLEDYSRRLVEFQSFCLCILTNDDAEEDIKFEAGQTLVKIGEYDPYVLSQESIAQSNALKEFIQTQFEWTPVISDLIWLKKYRSSFPHQAHNLLLAKLTFIDLLERVCQFRPPQFKEWRNSDAYYFYRCTTEESADQFTRLYDLFLHPRRIAAVPCPPTPAPPTPAPPVPPPLAEPPIELEELITTVKKPVPWPWALLFLLIAVPAIGFGLTLLPVPGPFSRWLQPDVETPDPLPTAANMIGGQVVEAKPRDTEMDMLLILTQDGRPFYVLIPRKVRAQVPGAASFFELRGKDIAIIDVTPQKRPDGTIEFNITEPQQLKVL